MAVVLREGDPADEIASGVTVSPGSYVLINDRGELLCDVLYSGPGIDDGNSRARLLWRNSTPRVIMRDGDPAPGLSPSLTLCDGFVFMGAAAMNRVGDIVGPTRIAGPGVTTDNNVVLWMWHRVLQRWIPFLRTGDEVQERCVSVPAYVSHWYSSQTGGGDGRIQSFNDRGMLAIGLSFTDGTDGLYRITPPAFGDADGDGDVDATDLAVCESCLRGVDNGVSKDCAAVFDLDEDADMDMADIAMLQQLAGP
jgi:hypothetical protein